MDERLKIIANTYGYDAQSRQLIEEMAELTQAINKFWRKQLDCGRREYSDIEKCRMVAVELIEEIADIDICLEQIKYLLHCKLDVERVKKKKIERQMERIKNKE